MDLRQKVEALGESAQYDLCNTCGAHAERKPDDLGRWIYPVAMPNGGQVRLLKILLTNVCEKNCYYCGIRARLDVPRTAFEPDELARAFDQMHRANLVDGLFLSSAVCVAADRTMDRMIAAVDLLRHRYRFDGYVHLKMLPGISEAHVERAVHLAQRVSVNLEAPNAERLARIAPHKVFYEELTQPMTFARRLMDDSGGRLAPAGQTTQFVVGAAGEADREILFTTAHLYRTVRLARAYFSAFQPVPGTPLDGKPAAPLWREHRLYQADWLLRFYGFTFDDLVFDPGGNLPRQADPKRMWAQAHPERYPVEVNRASREELLRVPGIGPKSAARILRWRREGTVHDLVDLARAGVVAQRAAPYVLLAGKRPPHQLSLWDEARSAASASGAP